MIHFSKKRLACFRSYRVYLIRNQVANKTLSLDKSPESIRKLQRLCESINKEAGEMDKVSNQQFEEGDVEEIEISVKQPEE